MKKRPRLDRVAAEKLAQPDDTALDDLGLRGRRPRNVVVRARGDGWFDSRGRDGLCTTEAWGNARAVRLAIPSRRDAGMRLLVKAVFLVGPDSNLGAPTNKICEVPELRRDPLAEPLELRSTQALRLAV